MVVPMMRPDVFGALASHAGDALFEACYLPEFPQVARQLRDDYEGSYEVFFERLAAADRFDFETYFPALDIVRVRRRLLARPRQPGQGAAPVRRRHRPPDRRRVGAVARPRSGADGPSAR